MALKFLKFALVAVAVLSLFDGTEQTDCGRRSMPHDLIEQELCREPQKTSVKLKVPTDFAFVEPSFVRVKRCKGLSCGHRKHCEPLEGSITERTLEVKAFRGDEVECVNITVLEHEACQCKCQDPGCHEKMVIDKNTCKCVCGTKEEQKKCIKRQHKEGKVMWSTNTCSCVCNTDLRRHCSTGETFDDENCKCVLEEYGSDEYYYN